MLKPSVFHLEIHVEKHICLFGTEVDRQNPAWSTVTSPELSLSPGAEKITNHPKVLGTFSISVGKP